MSLHALPFVDQVVLADLRSGLQYVHDHYLGKFDRAVDAIRSLHIVLFVIAGLLMAGFALFMVGGGRGVLCWVGCMLVL